MIYGDKKMTTLVLDNGAYAAKIGYSHEKVRYDELRYG